VPFPTVRFPFRAPLLALLLGLGAVPAAGRPPSPEADSACVTLRRALPTMDSLRYADFRAALAFWEGLRPKAEGCDDPELLLTCYDHLSGAAYLAGEYELAADYVGRQREVGMRLDDPGRQGLLLNQLGHFVCRFGQWDKAHEYLDQAQAICETAADTFCLTLNLDHRGVVFMRQGRVALARERFEQCLALREAHRDTVGLGYVCEHLGWVAMEEGRNREALDWTRRALRYRRAGGQPDAMAININNLGEAHQALGQFDSATIYYEDAVHRAARLGLVDLQRHALERLSACAQATGRYEEAMDHLRRSFALKDSLIGEEQVRAVARMEAEYDAALREQRIAIQQLDLERQRAVNRNQLLIGAGLLAVLLLLGAFFWQRFRNRQEQRLQEARLAHQEALLRHAIEVQEAERKRIARDLHDGIGQRLGGLKLAWSRWAERFGRQAPEQRGELQRLTGVLDETAQEVRALSHQMMPRALSAVGLAAALQDLVDQQFRRSGVVARLEQHGAGGRFDERVEIALYRIAQEALGNITKHAAARRVDVQLHRAGGRLILTVEDDGRGFDPVRVRGGHGLANLQSRAGAVGGDLHVESAPGNGTVITVRVPVSPEPAAEWPGQTGTPSSANGTGAATGP
jgi:signal transduction histidine kinase